MMNCNDIPYVDEFAKEFVDISADEAEKHTSIFGTKYMNGLPIIPGINDTPLDVALLCDFLVKHQKYLDKVHILPYHNMALGKYDALGKNYELNHVKAPSNEHMQDIQKTIAGCGFDVVIGG